MPNEDPWPTPLELFDLMDAVKAGQKQVVMSRRKFTITYLPDGDFLVKPIKGYAPMGRFDMEIFREIGG